MATDWQLFSYIPRHGDRLAVDQLHTAAWRHIGSCSITYRGMATDWQLFSYIPRHGDRLAVVQLHTAVWRQIGSCSVTYRGMATEKVMTTNPIDKKRKLLCHKGSPI